MLRLSIQLEKRNVGGALLYQQKLAFDIDSSCVGICRQLVY